MTSNAAASDIIDSADTTPAFTAPRPRRGYFAAAIGGIAWNIFGIFQFLSTGLATKEDLVLMKMTPEQAAFYVALPGWMTAAFAIGVFGGLAGAALLLWQHKAAVPVLAASLAAYIVLYIGDYALGVFAMLGMGQVVILTIVVAIAVVLFAIARGAQRRGLLHRS